MVRCVKARRNKTGCQLDPDKMVEHEAYFRSTFGGAPMGHPPMTFEVGYPEVIQEPRLISEELIQNN